MTVLQPRTEWQLQGQLVSLGVSSLAGAFTAGLVAAVQQLAGAVLGGPAVLRLGPSLLLGAVMGLALALGRRGKQVPTAFTLLVGAVTGLAAGLLEPLVVAGSPAAGWWALLVRFLVAALITSYGLRELNLYTLRRDLAEVLLLRAGRAIAFVALVGVVVFPFYAMLVASLKPRIELLEDPTNITVNLARPIGELLAGYREVLLTFNFAEYIANSAFVAVVTVLITMTLGTLGAYAVTRLRFPGREWLSRSILLIYMVPTIVLVIPLYTVFTQLGLRDTLQGLLVVYPATTLPVALYMLRSYFQTLPADLEEAGLIDGCSRAQVIWRITLPLSAPALASVALYVFMIAWNEFLFAFMFLDDPAIFTLSRGMVALDNQEVPRQFLMAGSVIVTVPIMVLFLFFERYLVSGLTAGSVKG